MPIDFYRASLSIPCRSVLLCIRQLDLDVNIIDVNILEKEHMTDEFLAINPCHSVPTMVDGDVKVWESRAILGYLGNQYGTDTDLYPSDPAARAVVDNLLYFDIGTLNTRFNAYVFPVMFVGETPDESKLEKLMDAVKTLNTFLEGNDYVAGENMTIADFTIFATISCALSCGLDITEDNVVAWVERCKEEMKGYDESMEGAEQFAEFYRSKIEDQ